MQSFTCPVGCSGEEEEDQPETMEEVGLEEEDLLECFRCDLGFWDACYTTRVYCSPGERCFTGRGKAGGPLPLFYPKHECRHCLHGRPQWESFS